MQRKPDTRPGSRHGKAGKCWRGIFRPEKELRRFLATRCIHGTELVSLQQVRVTLQTMK
jgi:hypothetical protein